MRTRAGVRYSASALCIRKLRIKSRAPTSRTTASESCATTRPLRSRDSARRVERAPPRSTPITLARHSEFAKPVAPVAIANRRVAQPADLGLYGCAVAECVEGRLARVVWRHARRDQLLRA